MALRLGDRQAARTHLGACLLLIQAGGERYSEVQIRYRSLVPLALAEGRPDEAMEHVEAAASICQALGTGGREFVAILRSRADVLLARGQPEAALTASTEAMAQLTTGVARGVYLVPYTHYPCIECPGSDGGGPCGHRTGLPGADDESGRLLARTTAHESGAGARVPGHRCRLGSGSAPVRHGPPAPRGCPHRPAPPRGRVGRSPLDGGSAGG